MASREIMFENIVDDKRDISLADKNGKKLISNGQGEIVMTQHLNDDRIWLKNVLCVPDINMNLLSVAKITDYGYNVKFGAIVYRNEDDIKMTAIREKNAYVKYYVKSKITENERAATVEDIDIWHKRFGHTNKKLIEKMKRKDLVIGINGNKERRQCEPCVEGKMCRKAYPRLISRKTSKIMELWRK